ncbi:hypothetical protein [Candidatus Agathobaculum pullicola]|uniref:hypothetical protein n=1 Tax=Candidatus Agathobaculum pullicola TaxID=2838426 RepID=UPI003F8DADF2
MTERADELSMQFMLVLSITTVGTSYQMACDNGVIRGGGRYGLQCEDEFNQHVAESCTIFCDGGILVEVSAGCSVFLLKWDQLYKAIPVVIRLRSWKWVKKVTRPDAT